MRCAHHSMYWYVVVIICATLVNTQLLTSYIIRSASQAKKLENHRKAKFDIYMLNNCNWRHHSKIKRSTNQVTSSDRMCHKRWTNGHMTFTPTVSHVENSHLLFRLLLGAILVSALNLSICPFVHPVQDYDLRVQIW